MKIKKVPISDIKPADYNPRKDLKAGDPEFERIKTSIEKFDIVEPLVLNGYNNVLIGGHQRLKVMKALGHKDAQCVIVNIDDPLKEKELNLALNKAVGGWDLPVLETMMLDLEKEGADLDWLNMDELFVDAGGGGATDVEEDDEVDVEPPPDPVSKVGKMYALGNHRVICGSSTDETIVKLLMGKKLADLIFTDPPYGVDYVGKTKSKLTIQNDALGIDGTYSIVRDFLEIAPLKPGGAYYICAPSGDMLLAFINAIADSGMLFKAMLVWVKDTLVFGRSDYHWKHEGLLYGWKPGAAHYFVDDRKQDTVWEIPRPKRSVDHPTMKPLALCARAIQNSSKPGELVYEPFGGSGSTLIACEQVDRVCRAIEIDPRYVDVIRRRWWAQVCDEGKEGKWEKNTPAI